jgi:UDP-glucose 4-epimerase
MRIFLTGANGYLGSLLAARLAELPEVESMTGIALTKQSRPVPDKMKFMQFDMRSPQLPSLMAGHDVVVHTACVVLWPAKMPVQERDDININGVQNVARVALDVGIKKFIHASSLGAYDPDQLRGKTDVKEDFPLGNGKSPFYYWNAKAEGEHILNRTIGNRIPMTFLRPIYIIGPRNYKVVANYQKNAVNLMGMNPRRQFIHEEDVADAFIRALRQDLPGAYNVVPDDFIRLSDTWRIVGKKFVPTIPLSAAALITAIRWKYFGSQIHESWVRDIPLDFTGSNAKLKATGWKPRCGSEEALASAVRAKSPSQK